MIDQHIETLRKKAEGIERRLCETDETLNAEKLMAILKELGETVQCMQYLSNIKAVREQNALVKPVRAQQAEIGGKLVKL